MRTYSKIDSDGDPIIDRLQDQIMQVTNPIAKNRYISEGIDEQRCIAIYSTNTAVALTTATFTVMNYDVPEYDTDNAVTVGTDWHFTVPTNKDGLYHISAGASLNNAASVYRVLLDVFRNNIEYRTLSDGPSIASVNGPGPAGACVVRLNVADRVAIKVYQTSGGSVNTAANAAAYSRVEIVRLTGC